MIVTWSFSLYPDSIRFPLYMKSFPPTIILGSSVPGETGAPAANFAFPNHPFSYSFFRDMSISFSFWADRFEIPVAFSSSDLCSVIFILSTILAGRFFTAILGSSKKNVLPLTVILETLSPLSFTCPPSETSNPGIFLRRSPSTAFSAVRNIEAL